MNGNDRSLIELQFTSIHNGIVTTMFDYLIFLVFYVWQIFILFKDWWQYFYAEIKKIKLQIYSLVMLQKLFSFSFSYNILKYIQAILWNMVWYVLITVEIVNKMKLHGRYFFAFTKWLINLNRRWCFKYQSSVDIICFYYLQLWKENSQFFQVAAISWSSLRVIFQRPS